MADIPTEETLALLKVEHRDLDEIVDYLIENKYHDDGKIQRFKRRKLMLRDQIAKLEQQMASS